MKEIENRKAKGAVNKIESNFLESSSNVSLPSQANHTKREKT